MRKLTFLTLILALFSFTAFGQLSGPKSIPGDYATLAAAIADLNAQGVAAPGVTFTLASGYTETFASPTSGIISATGVNMNSQIIFQGTTGGTKPVITAGVGTSTSVDGIIIIRGGDYITFDGIDLQENVANTTATQQMEWGFALVKASATDGAQYNTIKNCAVTLNKTNAASAGIYFGNHIEINTTALTVTNLTGTNSDNKINGNTITNVFTPIYIVGFNDVTPFTYYDQNNEIGFTLGNNLTNYGGASTNYGVYLRYNNNAKVSNNTIATTGTTSTTRGIFLAGSTNASVDVNNNTISIQAAATTSQVAGIETAIAGTGSGNTINIIGNIIQNCTYTTATTGTFYGIYNSVTSSSNININSNAILNNSLPGTGAMTLIDGGGCTTLNVNNNNINGNTKTGASGSLFGIRAGTTVASFSGNQIYNNSFTATTGTSAANIYGIYNFGSPTQETYQNNIIHDMSITGASTSTSCLLCGIYTNTIAASVITASGNSVYNLTYNNSSTGACNLSGIRFVTGSTITISKNNIYNLISNGSTSVVDGIRVSGGTTWNIFNNFVSDLKAPTANAATPVIGINIGGGTNVNAYYNTVFINATSAGALFGTSGIYASTTPTVDLRNNIVVNTSTIMGAGLTAAYRRSGASLITHAPTSNNNCFFVGTPSATNVIYTDGTNTDQDLAAFQTRVAPREAVSFMQLPPFVNIATAPYDLHLQTTVATMCESGGVRITTPAITTDIDNNTRWGETGYTGTGSSTDVGADEMEGMPSFTCAAPAPGNTVASATSICFGEIINFSLQTPTAGTGVSYVWQSSADGITYANITGATSATYSAPPQVPTYYQCVVTCMNGPSTATSTPVQVTFTNSITSTTPGTRCGSGVVALAAVGSVGSTLNWYDAAAAGTLVGTGSPFNTPVISANTTYYVAAETYTSSVGNITIGNGTTTNGTTGYPTAFGNYWYQNWHQVVYTASELQALGLSAGNINSISFNLLSLPSPNTPPTDYNVSLGSTSNSVLTAWQTTGLTSCFGPAAPPALTIGWNTITFTTPYVWDGTSNIIVDIRSTELYGSANAQTYNSVTTGNMTLYSYSTSNNAAYWTSSPAPTATTSRFNIRFNGNLTTVCSSPRIPVVATVGAATPISLTPAQTVCNNGVATMSVTSTLSEYDSYVWTPETNLFTDLACTVPYTVGGNASTVYLKTATAGDYTYTCTANNSVSLCSDIENTSVTVIPATATITASEDQLCFSGTPTISATPATGWGTATFEWWASENGTNFAFTGSTNLTETPNIDTTTWAKLLVYVGANLCFESAVGVITVNEPQVLTTTPGSRCGTGTVNLAATASSGTTVLWYDALTGGNQIATGTSFTTPVITASTDYYAEASILTSSISETVGSAVLPVTPPSSGSTDAGIVFTTTANNVLIESANILVTGTGNITFQLQSSTGTVIANYVAAITGATTAAFTTVTFPATFMVPTAGAGYRLLATAKDAGIIWYYTAGAYPYNSLGGALTTTGGWGWGSASSYADQIRCIYNINIKVDEYCNSSRTVVSAVVTAAPAITVSSTPATICQGESTDLLVSSTNTAYTYEWSSGDLTASFTDSPATTTTYTVTASDVSGCVAVGSALVTVNPLPVGISATASQASVSCGSTVDLNATPASGNVVVLEENFNGATNNWITTNNSTGGTPALAAWTLQADGYVYGTTTLHSNDNSQFYLSNSDEQGSGGTTATLLESPSFSTVGTISASLSFYHYYYHGGGSAMVEVWDGTTWTPEATYTSTLGTATAFVEETVDLTAYVGLPDVKIRFSYNCAFAWYWAIDNVTIDAVNPTFTYAWTSTPAGFTSTTQSNAGVAPLASTDYTVVVTTPQNCSATATVSVAVTALPAPTVTVADNCGSSVLTASNYTGTLTWNTTESTPSITVTSAGNYNVFYTDGSCVSQNGTAIAAPITIPAIPGVTNQTVCTGATIPDLTVTGTGTMNWYDDVAMTNLVNTGLSFATGETAAATYTYYVNATDNGCTGPEATITLTINEAPSATLTPTNPSACGLSDGTIAATTGFTYNWSTNPVQTNATATGLNAGAYFVTVSNANCSIELTATLSDPGAPTVTLSATDSSICPSTLVTFTAGGADTYEFFINGNSVQGPSATNTFESANLYDGYAVTVNGTTTGCTGISTAVDMTVFTPAAVTISEVSGSLVSDATSGNQWYEQTTGLLTDSINATITPVVDGNFYVVVTDANGCTSTSNVINFIYVSASNVDFSAGISVYPNPSNGMVFVKSNSPVNYAVTTIDGKVILRNEVKSTEATMDLSSHAKGIYFVRFSNDTETAVYRIVIE